MDSNDTFCLRNWSHPSPAVLDDHNISTLFNSCNCTQWPLDTMDAEPISIIRIITSLISVVGSASIILSVLLTGKLNTSEVHPLFMLSVADFILSILWMIGGIVWLSPGEGGWASSESDSHAGMCYVLAIATTMAEMVTFMLTAVYALSALLRIREVYRNKGKTLTDKDKRKRCRHFLTALVYIISWVLPLVIVLSITESIIGIGVTNHGCWCILDFFNLRPDDGSSRLESPFNQFAILQATILGVVFLLATAVIIALYGMTYFYVRKVVDQQRDLVSEESKGPRTIKTIMFRLSLFVIIFLICGVPSFVASILVWAERERLHLDETADRVVLYIHALTSPLQGILNAIVYGWSRRRFRKAISINRMHFTRDNHGITSARYESLNDAGPGAPGARVSSLRLGGNTHTS